MHSAGTRRSRIAPTGASAAHNASKLTRASDRNRHSAERSEASFHANAAQALASWNRVTRSAGTRPRVLTSMPCASAQARTAFGS